jgi:hypothetical protein
MPEYTITRADLIEMIETASAQLSAAARSTLRAWAETATAFNGNLLTFNPGCPLLQSGLVRPYLNVTDAQWTFIDSFDPATRRVTGRASLGDVVQVVD